MTQPTPQPPLTLDIEGATCAGCVRKIETALRAVPGVAQADMNFATRTATVAGSASSAELIAAVQGIGYSASLPDAAEEPAGVDQDPAEGCVTEGRGVVCDVKGPAEFRVQSIAGTATYLVHDDDAAVVASEGATMSCFRPGIEPLTP